MIELDPQPVTKRRATRRVLLLADASANWKIAGLRQIERIVFSFAEFARSGGERIELSVLWEAHMPIAQRLLPSDPRARGVAEVSGSNDAIGSPQSFDLMLSTRVFISRNSIPELLKVLPATAEVETSSPEMWRRFQQTIEAALSLGVDSPSNLWRFLRNEDEIPACEREFLRNAGKTQDGLVSRYVNRPVSRACSRLLLKTGLTPSTWSVLIFSLPLSASLLLLRGNYRSFVLGCVIYQLYSILDGCDGEIARAKFQQTEFGRRLDSLLDLIGNILLALCLGFGLARQWSRAHANGWLYITEGLAAAAFIILSEGIVFARRTRGESVVTTTKWNGALYQRHHEFLERSGILVLGDKFAWWLVQLTKRDMGILAFALLAAFGWPEAILHLLLVVSGVSSALAGNAFLRQPASALAPETS